MPPSDNFGTGPEAEKTRRLLAQGRRLLAGQPTEIPEPTKGTIKAVLPNAPPKPVG